MAKILIGMLPRYCFLFGLISTLFACAHFDKMHVDFSYTQDQVRSSVDSARQFTRKGQHEQAAKKYSKVALIADETDRKTILQELLRISELLIIYKQPRHALPYYKTAIEISHASNDTKWEIEANEYLARLYYSIGEIDLAINCYNQVIELKNKDPSNTKTLSTTLINRAAMYITQGSFQQATIDLKKAENLLIEYPKPRDSIRVNLEFGHINFAKGNQEYAFRYFKSALDLATKTQKAEDLQIRASNNLGKLYRQQASFSAAEKAFESSVEMYNEHWSFTMTKAETNQLDATHAIAQYGLGELYKTTGELDKAKEHLSRAFDFYNQTHNKLRMAIILTYMAEIELKKHQFNQARKRFLKAHEIYTNSKFPYGIARSELYLGIVDFKQGLKTSFRHIDNAYNLYLKMKDHDGMRRSLFWRGQFFERQGQFGQAKMDYKASIEHLVTVASCVHGGKQSRKLYQKSAVDANVLEFAYQRLINILVDENQAQEALEIIQSEKQYKIASATKAGIYTSPGSEVETLLQKINSLECKILRAKLEPYTFSYAKQMKLDNDQHLSDLYKELHDLYPSTYNLITIQPTDFESFRTKLSDHQILLEYYPRDNKPTLIFTVTNKPLSNNPVKLYHACVSNSDCLNSDNTENLVKAFKKKIESSKLEKVLDDGEQAAKCPNIINADRNRTPLQCYSTEIFRYLIHPIEDEIKNYDTIAISTTGPLSYLPFAALARISKSGELKYLIQEKGLFFVVRFHLPDTPSHWPNDPKSIKIAGFINPDKTLPNSKSEAEAIQRNFTSPQLYENDEATKTKFYDIWDKVQVIHLAAHSDLTGDTIKIKLAPSNTPEGTLTGEEILRLKSNGTTRLVVLSVCETAIKHSHNVIGSLADSFLMKNLELNVISTIWSIADSKETSLLMDKFYDYMADKESGYTALRKSQLALIREHGRFNNPFYWAGYVYMGFPGTL